MPVLIFMGAMLQSAGFAGDLLAALQRLAGRRRAALPVAVMAIGLLLAPLAGAIAASVSTLALLAHYQTLLERGYRPSAAGGVVAAAGTLGVIVPPSIMLFFIADSLGVQVPALFLGMLLRRRSCSRSTSRASCWPNDPAAHRCRSHQPTGVGAARGRAPARLAGAPARRHGRRGRRGMELAVGGRRARRAAGATLARRARRAAELADVFDAVVHRTVLVTSMIFFIFVGASLFALVFHLLGGGRMLAAGTRALDLGAGGTLVVIMLAVVFACWGSSSTGSSWC